MSARISLYASVLSLAVFALSAGAAQAATVPASPSNGSYSAALLYNQANAYARAGEPGMAVLDYERARLLAPADPDIRANLRYVRATSNLPSPTRNWFEDAERIASPSTFYWIGCAGLLLAAVSELARRKYPGHRRLARAFTIAGLALMMGTIGNAIVIWPTMREAVVIAPIAPVRVAPVTAADVLVTLREAQIVTVEAQRPDFLLVHTDAGHTGWVSRSDIARVVPRRDE